MEKRTLSSAVLVGVLVFGSSWSAWARQISYTWELGPEAGVLHVDMGKKSCEAFKAAFSATPGVQASCDTDDVTRIWGGGTSVGVRFASWTEFVLGIRARRSGEFKYEHVATATSGAQTQQVFNRGQLRLTTIGAYAGPRFGTDRLKASVAVGIEYFKSDGEFSDERTLNGVRQAGQTLTHDDSGWAPSLMVSISSRLRDRIGLMASYTRGRLDAVPDPNPARAKNPVNMNGVALDLVLFLSRPSP